MASPYARLVLTGEPCEVDEQCKAGRSLRGPAGSSCSDCRWSPEEPDGGTDRFRPVEKQTIFRRREEALRQDKKDALAARRAQQVERRQTRDKKRVAINRQAERAERQTERNIIHATVNSGRAHRDGDHISGGSIVLDTKLQTGRDHPVVNLAELAKVRADAKRNGYAIGGLVLRNKHGVGVVVFDEADYAMLVKL